MKKSLKRDIKENINFWFKFSEIFKTGYIIINTLFLIFILITFDKYGIIMDFFTFMIFGMIIIYTIFIGMLVYNWLRWKGFMLLTNYEVCRSNIEEE